MEKKTRTNNQLTQERFWLLCETIRNKEEWFKQNNPSWRNAAEFLSKELGFRVCDHQVNTAARLTKVTWEVQDTRRNLVQNKFKEETQKLHAKIDALAAVVNELCTQLGMKQNGTPDLFPARRNCVPVKS